jgi:hypothetical protein
MTALYDAQLYDYVTTKLNEREKELQEFIAQGTVKDFNEYHRLCGVIQGLTFAKETITGLVQHMETEDDE